jgi:hypothetical protein
MEGEDVIASGARGEALSPICRCGQVNSLLPKHRATTPLVHPVKKMPKLPGLPR